MSFVDDAVKQRVKMIAITGQYCLATSFWFIYTMNLFMRTMISKYYWVKTRTFNAGFM